MAVALGACGLVGTIRQQIETFPVKQIKRVRIVRRADGYYCQFGVQAEAQVEHHPTGKQVGIDIGLKAFFTDSEGNTVENPRHYRKAEKKLKRLHRQRLPQTEEISRTARRPESTWPRRYLKVQRQREDFARKTGERACLVSRLDCLRTPSDPQHGEKPTSWPRASTMPDGDNSCNG